MPATPAVAMFLRALLKKQLDEEHHQGGPSGSLGPSPPGRFQDIYTSSACKADDAMHRCLLTPPPVTSKGLRLENVSEDVDDTTRIRPLTRDTCSIHIYVKIVHYHSINGVVFYNKTSKRIQPTSKNQVVYRNIYIHTYIHT